MALVNLQVRTVDGTYYRQFETDKLSFTRSITRQGKGARKAWRDIFAGHGDAIPESHGVIRWNARRLARRTHLHGATTLHGIRAQYRAAQQDPWAMIDKPEEGPTPESIGRLPRELFGDTQAAPGSDDY